MKTIYFYLFIIHKKKPNNIMDITIVYNIYYLSTSYNKRILLVLIANLFRTSSGCNIILKAMGGGLNTQTPPCLLH